MMTRRAAMRVAGGMTAVIASQSLRAAPDWPNRPVKIVLAIGPGSAGDLIARMLKPHLEAIWKQAVVVENRPGAGGIIGSQYVAKATDNHTLLMASHSSILPKLTKKELDYDPLTDLLPIYKIVNYQMFLGVNAQTARSARTLKELIALSRSTPQGLIFAGLGRTASYNIAMSILNRSLGIQYTALDYNSIGEMNLAILRGDAQFGLNTPSAVKGQIDAGAIRPLAVLSAERYPNLPDVPTVVEAAGYKGYMPLLWAGLMAPKSMPATIVDRVAADMLQLAQDRGVKAQIEGNITGTVLRSSPAEYSRQIAEEVAVWEELFRAMKIQPQ